MGWPWERAYLTRPALLLAAAKWRPQVRNCGVNVGTVKRQWEGRTFSGNVVFGLSSVVREGMVLAATVGLVTVDYNDIV